MARWLDRLLELRVREGRVRGAFDDLPTKGRPLPPDPLASLPSERRSEARLIRTLGVVPDEVRMMNQIAALKDQLSACEDEALRSDLRRALRDRRIELNLLFERTGRAHLLGTV